MNYTLGEIFSSEYLRYLSGVTLLEVLMFILLWAVVYYGYINIRDRINNLLLELEALRKLRDSIENQNVIRNETISKPMIKFVKEKVEEEVKQEVMKEVIPEETKVIIQKEVIKRGIIKSKDPEIFPQIFNTLYELNNKLIKMIGVMEISRRLNVSPPAISAITRKEIRTVDTARKYIKEYNRVLKDLIEEAKEINIEDSQKVNKDDTTSVLSIKHKERLEELGLYDKEKDNSIAAKIKETEEAEKRELSRLIDYLLSQMSQPDLAIRCGITQSTLSYIYNRKQMRRNSIQDYIFKLKKVETAILGIGLTHNKLGK